MPGCILVPLDGSAFSARALPIAAAIAKARGESLHLLSVHTPLVVQLSFAEAPAYDTTFDDTQRAALRSALDEYARRLKAELGVAATVVVVDGETPAAIAAEASSCQASLIVMTTHGRGGFTRAWLGSVADELVRRSPVPLLLVRPADAATDPGAGSTAGTAGLACIAEPERVSLASTHRFQRILIPLDGSPLAEEIIEPALALGIAGETTCLLLRVVIVPPSLLPPAETFWTPRELEAQQAARSEAEEYLERLAGRVRAAGHLVESHVVLGSDVARVILHESGTRGVDLIAISTNARGGLARLRLGSVADKLVRGAVCPTLVARPRGHG